MARDTASGAEDIGKKVMNWRRVGEVAAGSALLFIVPPFVVVKVFSGTLTDGVLIGTGIAIVWYAVETLYLRRETSSLRQAAALQSKVAVEQAEASIRPLIVSRFELVLPMRQFVLRNIGHGPAIFVKTNSLRINVPDMGDRQVRFFPVDLIEPGDIGIPGVEFFPAEEGQTEFPSHDGFIDSIVGQRASKRYEITITYSDVQNRRFYSLMEMGKDGIKLLKSERLPS